MMPLILATILSALHFFSQKFHKFAEKHHYKVLSFSSGLLVCLIFLEFFAELTEGLKYVNVYLFLLSGFVFFHLLEKYVYQHTKEKIKLVKELRELHIAGFFIDHFTIGFILTLVAFSELKLGLLIFLPFALHTISSSMALEAIHKGAESYNTKIILSVSTIIGALTAKMIGSIGVLYYGLFAFSLGAIFYIVIRDVIPQKEGGNPTFFIVGILLNAILVYLAKVL